MNQIKALLSLGYHWFITGLSPKEPSSGSTSCTEVRVNSMAGQCETESVIAERAHWLAHLVITWLSPIEPTSWPPRERLALFTRCKPTYGGKDRTVIYIYIYIISDLGTAIYLRVGGCVWELIRVFELMWCKLGTTRAQKHE